MTFIECGADCSDLTLVLFLVPVCSIIKILYKNCLITAGEKTLGLILSSSACFEKYKPIMGTTGF